MKKLLSTLAVATALSTSAQAGSVVDFEVGGGVWFSGPAGTMALNYGTLSTSYDLVGGLGLQGAAPTYMWAVVDHLIPVVPNFRYETTAGMTYENAAKTNSLKMDNADYIGYWGIPFSTWLPFIDEFDVGIGFKAFNGMSLTAAAASGTAPFFGLPYGYTKLRVEPPMLFGLGFEGEYKVIAFDINSFSELIIKADWGIEAPIPVIDMEVGVEFGYRSTALKLAIDASNNIDVSFSGIFFGAYGKFGI